MKKAYKYRFYPTDEQKVLLSKTFGCVRVVWNQTLAWRTSEFKNNEKSVNSKDASKFLTQLKSQSDFSWLSEPSAVPLQQALRNQESAFSRFFKKQGGYPNFKKRNNKQSAKYTSNAFSYLEGSLQVAKFKEPLNVVWSRRLPKKPTSITISKDAANRYFVSCLCEILPKRKIPIAKAIGIDLGLKDFATTSDGEKLLRKNFTKIYEIRLAVAQRRLSKKQKGSKNRDKARIKVARVHTRISDSRMDYLHKFSRKIINENQIVCLEDLNVKGMIKNHSLSKSIADASWSEFVRQLAYKASWAGRTIIKVSRWLPSSKNCSTEGCDYKNTDLTLADRSWQCPLCGTLHDRDINAAKNILTAGLAGLVCGV